jgi:hypothetical protein
MSSEHRMVGRQNKGRWVVGILRIVTSCNVLVDYLAVFGCGANTESSIRTTSGSQSERPSKSKAPSRTSPTLFCPNFNRLLVIFRAFAPLSISFILPKPTKSIPRFLSSKPPRCASTQRFTSYGLKANLSLASTSFTSNAHAACVRPDTRNHVPLFSSSSSSSSSVTRRTSGLIFTSAF